MGAGTRGARAAAVVVWLSAAAAAAQPATTTAQGPVTSWTADQQREFLSKAEFVSGKETGKGVTRPMRVRLRAGGVEHEGVFQSVDVNKGVLDVGRTRELNFRDYYGFNIAAHHLACLLERCRLVPAAVERVWRGRAGALVWWVPDIAMDEAERVKRDVRPPLAWQWRRQSQLSRLFTELTADTDRNQTNLLITHDWGLVLIDFTRAFRLRPAASDLRALDGIEADVFDALRALTAERLAQVAGRWLAGGEIDAVLRRRDRLVAHFDGLVAQKGRALVVYPPLP